MKNYQLLDSGNLQKLELFGSIKIIRPCMQAIWRHVLSEKHWEDVDFKYVRENKNKWIKKTNKPTSWVVDIEGIKLKLKLTDFGHIGFFPEHVLLCKKMESLIKGQEKKINILNLFAYTGLASLFALKNRARVCHVDSSKPTMSWAKENAQLNNFDASSIRWIFDDAMKFIKREVKRGSKYNGIILDPPSFGRGAKKEVFKIETDIYPLLDLCKQLLSKKSSFIIFSCHTPGFTKNVIKNFLNDVFKGKDFFEIDELLINSEKSYPLPSGFYAIWQK